MMVIGLQWCNAKIRVDREIDGLGERHLELECTLGAPHPLYKHLNLRIQATIGGERWTDDPQWSYYLEKLPEGIMLSDPGIYESPTEEMVEVYYQTPEGSKQSIKFPVSFTEKQNLEKLLWPSKITGFNFFKRPQTK